eukprot:TRINITY_DN823_c0_g1_i2.p1 TRINITY_DN823_c0_g1~~TRINITY_DN823_c0_g1_i2.p1  ORF type:complete len:161 (+),score=66.47 TRINITY_DN823_c0_g1_i2:53-535(+)
MLLYFFVFFFFFFFFFFFCFFLPHKGKGFCWPKKKKRGGEGEEGSMAMLCLLLAVLDVVLFRQQLLKLVQLRQLELGEPALALGVLVDEGGVALQLRVDLGDFTRHGRVDVANSLDALDDTCRPLGLEGGADGGELDENEVAEGVLRVVGDAHRPPRTLR